MVGSGDEPMAGEFRTNDLDKAALAARRLLAFMQAAHIRGGTDVFEDVRGGYCIQAVLIRPEREDILALPLTVDGLEVKVFPLN